MKNSLFYTKRIDYKKNYIKEVFNKTIEANEPDYNIINIAKAIYRKQFNQYSNIQNTINDIQKILSKSKISENNKKNALAHISKLAIPTPSNDLEAFHNFKSIEYFIYKKDKLKNIDSKFSQKLFELCPLYYQNGLFCINPLLKNLWNDTAESRSEYFKNAKKSNTTSIEHKDISNFNEVYKFDYGDLLDNIDNFNKSDFLRKMFENKIIEYKIKRGNEDYNINQNNFIRFCKLFHNYIDTIAIYEYGELKHTFTIPDNKIIKSRNNNKGSQNKGNQNKGIQNGGNDANIFKAATTGIAGVIVFTGAMITTIAMSIVFFYSIEDCAKHRGNIVRTVTLYPTCILWNVIVTALYGACITLDIAMPFITWNVISENNSCVFIFINRDRHQAAYSDPTSLFFDEFWYSSSNRRKMTSWLKNPSNTLNAKLTNESTIKTSENSRTS